MSATFSRRSRTQHPAHLYKRNKQGEVIGIYPDKIAQYLIEEFGVCRIGGSLYIFDFQKGCYVPGYDLIRKIIIDIYSASTRNDRAEIIAWLVAVMLPEIKRDPRALILFEDQIVDVEAYAAGDPDFILTPSKDIVITNRIPHAYDPDAICDDVDEYLDAISCGDSETKENLKQVIGLAMCNVRQLIQEFPFLLGVSAGNSKTTFLKVIKAILGKENYCIMMPRDLSHPFKAKAMNGKLAIIMDEIPMSRLKAETTSAIRSAACGEEFYADVKFNEPFTFENSALMIMASNGLPEYSHKDSEGLERRMHLIEMRANFRHDNPNTDERIIDRLTSDEAIARWIKLGVDGLITVLSNKGFTSNQASDALLQTTKSVNDSVYSWIMDAGIIIGDVVNKPTQIPYESYSDWCESANENSLPKAEFSKALIKHFPITTTTKSMNGRNVRWYAAKK